jgi:UDP-N-acetylglucosamine:LPS N-acetylglucosamine transferase
VDGRAGHPGRVLLLSASVGEGHVAAARAIANRVRRLWPDAEVREVEDTGRGHERRDQVLRASYALTMRVAPSLYGVGYDLLVRHPRFAELCKRVTAVVLGRSLAPLVAAERPDLVISTYPMTSAGLAWLRRRGRLTARTVAVVTDVAVHPYWVWPDLDETWTLLPASRDQARAIAPHADVRVAPPAVDPRFHPGDRQVARIGLGLRPDALVVLVTGGSLGFGGLDRLAAAVLAAGDGVQVVVLCGHNAKLRTHLLAKRVPASRLVVRGWTDRIPEHLTAADVVLTTAGGMIATEALAVGRPVLFAAPVPGHGRAGAEMSAAAGLALVCPTPADVTAAVRGFLRDPRELARLSRRAAEFGGRDIDVELVALGKRA